MAFYGILAFLPKSLIRNQIRFFTSDFSDFIHFFLIFRLFPTFRLSDSTTLIDFPDRLERTLTGRRDLEPRSPLHRSKPLRLSLNGTSEENIFFVFAHICICNFFVFLPRPLFVTLYSHLYFPFVLMTALIFVCNFNFISCPTYEP